MKEFARLMKTDGWLYFSIGAIPTLTGFLLSDAPKTGWVIAGTVLSSLGNGLIALKAFRSKSKEVTSQPRE